jgi:hypothetical protein
MPAGCKTVTSAPPATLPGQLVVAMSRHEGARLSFRHYGTAYTSSYRMDAAFILPKVRVLK